PTLRLHSSERITMAMLWPGILTIGYLLLVGLFYAAGQGPGQQVVPQPGRGGLDWPLWMVGGVGVGVMAYPLLLAPPPPAQAGAPALWVLGFPCGGTLVIAAPTLRTISLPQTRSPWLGAGAGLFVFFTLLLAQAGRRARAANSRRAALWRRLLIGEVVLALGLG